MPSPITEIVSVEGLKSLKALFISNKGGSFEVQITLLPRALQGLLFPFEKLSQVILAWFFYFINRLGLINILCL